MSGSGDGVRLRMLEDRMGHAEQRDEDLAGCIDGLSTSLNQRLAKLEQGEESRRFQAEKSHEWADSRFRGLEERIFKLEDQSVEKPWLDEKLGLRCDALKGENDLLREKLARKTRELSEMANSLALNQERARGRVAALESEVRRLREMNEAHLRKIEELENAAQAEARSHLHHVSLLQADLDEAREKGLSLGNAALRKGWEDCEKAVVAYVRQEGKHLEESETTGGFTPMSAPAAIGTLADLIHEGRHRPADFNAHAPSVGADTIRVLRGLAWTGADEVESAQEEPREMAGQFQRFRAPAGLPEEDPEVVADRDLGDETVAPVGGFDATGYAPGDAVPGTECIVVDPEPLREMERKARERPDVPLHSPWVLTKLTEAGVVAPSPYEPRRTWGGRGR